MAYRVLLTDDAADDLEGLHGYIATHDSPARAAHVLDGIERVFTSLAELPGRGSYPKELSALGIREYREVFFKPYRIVYRVIGDAVYVMLIADGRRDMQGLLARRLLRGGLT
jgi:toxin ParE1/3/4